MSLKSVKILGLDIRNLIEYHEELVAITACGPLFQAFPRRKVLSESGSNDFVDRDMLSLGKVLSLSI